MSKFILILTLIFPQGFYLFGQTDSIAQLEIVVKQIDEDSSLSSKDFDATEIYEQAFDGGGLIKVCYNQSGIKKIYQEIGVSFGRLTTIIYFDHGKPIKIIDREENFKWEEDNTGWDYSGLNQVFQENIYIFDWDTVKIMTMEEGQRKLSEESSSILEYEPLIQLGKELMKNRTDSPKSEK